MGSINPCPDDSPLTMRKRHVEEGSRSSRTFSWKEPGEIRGWKPTTPRSIEEIHKGPGSRSRACLLLLGRQTDTLFQFAGHAVGVPFPGGDILNQALPFLLTDLAFERVGNGMQDQYLDLFAHLAMSALCQ